MQVKEYIRTIRDFPEKGVMFRDVTTLFGDPRRFRIAVDQLLAPYAGRRIDKVVGLEARGFILGGAVAHQLSAGFVPVRKKGKLPAATLAQDYTLEYGAATVEIHDDAIEPGETVLIVDDLLATGGTAEAGIRLVVGARLDLADGPGVLVYPRDRAAYGRLSQVITTGRRRAEKGKPDRLPRTPLRAGRGVRRSRRGWVRRGLNATAPPATSNGYGTWPRNGSLRGSSWTRRRRPRLPRVPSWTPSRRSAPTTPSR